MWKPLMSCYRENVLTSSKPKAPYRNETRRKIIHPQNISTWFIPIKSKDTKYISTFTIKYPRKIQLYISFFPSKENRLFRTFMFTLKNFYYPLALVTSDLISLFFLLHWKKRFSSFTFSFFREKQFFEENTIGK